MTKSFFAWDSQGLVSWMESELKTRSSLKASQVLGIPIAQIQAWKNHPMPPISLNDLQALANYRGWSLEQTRQWLDIKPGHFERLSQED